MAGGLLGGRLSGRPDDRLVAADFVMSEADEAEIQNLDAKVLRIGRTLRRPVAESMQWIFGKSVAGLGLKPKIAGLDAR